MKIYKTLPDGIEIVEYEDSLAQAVADMWNKSGEGWGGTFDNGVYTAERMINKRASGAFFNVYVAMKDGEAIGYCSFDRYYKDENTAYVHLLNVRPDYYGKKIGKELVMMCVYETIARGMPRVDIHTWPGNTKAVPLYKKCGFFLEDRTDTTHLSNYIPTVLSTELLKDFFETADWNKNSTREIDFDPDGKKVNKFELYEYRWEKDGASLRVGFEKTGRRINLIETDDYKIELTAENHELAYGLRYPCQLHIKNKTGNKLSVSAIAKSDDVIDFNGTWSSDVSEEEVFTGSFFVNTITQAQDDMKMHPCVLAQVVVNGKHAELGLGIEPKFPVTVSLGRKPQAAKTGVSEDIYLNIANGLSSDATVTFTLPQNPLLQFSQSEYEVKLSGGKDISVKTTALNTDCGYTGIPVTYTIRMDNGETVTDTRPLHIVSQGISGKFGFETDENYGAVNGLWKLNLNKKSNIVVFDRLVASGQATFFTSQLGKPYDEEFNIMKPADIRVTEDGSFIRFETDFISGKFPGAVLTEIYIFDNAGTLKRAVRVTNKGTANLDLSVKTEFWSFVGRKIVYHYDGALHEVSDKMNFGFDTLDKTKIDENWIFDISEYAPQGIYWHEDYKPDARWGDLLVFEIPTGVLKPQQVFESEPIVYMCDVFKNFKDFRNYVRGTHADKMPLPHNHLEFIANGSNPVVYSGALTLTVRNNRQNTRPGTVRISSPDGFFHEDTQTNPDDKLILENAFTVPVTSDNTGIGLANFSICLSGFEKDVGRVLLAPDETALKTEDKDGVLTVTSGKLSYSADAKFSDAVFSLKYGENEWFFSNYPSTEPCSWWNPFVGGLKAHLTSMGDSLVLREKITAAFATKTDTLGNLWTGIKTTVTVEQFDKFKGISYTQYFLTLPGVPVLCHFTSLTNNTGRYLDTELNTLMFLSGEENLKNLRAEMVIDNTKYKVRLGGVEEMLWYDRLVKIQSDFDAPRPEKLYVYGNAYYDNGEQFFDYDFGIALCESKSRSGVPDGGSFTSVPIFCILSEKDLTLESLDDLRRVMFPND
ncbi:MAG: GNAT family N-acetyltransferase [Oscillospiraceae bacterium]|nr:GNAT family N-acetyltransferase [Oscillospiraceae bacterium]